MSSFICTNCGSEHHIFGHGGVIKAVEELNTNLLGQIPLEIDLRTASDKGQPYMAQQFAGRPVYEAFLGVAEKVDQFFSPVPEKPKSGIFSKILGLK
jgi:ATP-binding protein involved in chromosome partitioning